MKLQTKFLKEINRFRPLLKVVNAVEEKRMAEELAHNLVQIVRTHVTPVGIDCPEAVEKLRKVCR
jgi:hypothetical protein